MGIRGVPNARLGREMRTLEWLAGREAETTAEQWRAREVGAAKRGTTVDELLATVMSKLEQLSQD